MTPCSTLEQRWSACRDIEPQPVRGGWTHPRAAEWYGQWNHCARWWIAPTADRRPCTSPRRHQCRAGLTLCGYFTRQNWRLKQFDEGRRGYPHTDWDVCHNPLAGVRASDWLADLELDDATITGPDPGVKGWDY